MNSKKKKVAVFIIIILIAIAISIVIFAQYSEDKLYNKNESQSPTEKTQLISEENRNTENAKKELDEKMKSILTGVLIYKGETEEKYNNDKVTDIVNNFKRKKGIYLSEKSKDKILKLLKKSTDIEYTIDSDGYLRNNENKKTNDISKNINNIIDGNKNIIIDYNPYYYCKIGDDISTFEIEKTEYMEKFEQDDTIIMVLNPVKYEEEYESNNDLVEQIIKNINNQ